MDRCDRLAKWEYTCVHSLRVCRRARGTERWWTTGIGRAIHPDDGSDTSDQVSPVTALPRLKAQQDMAPPTQRWVERPHPSRHDHVIHGPGRGRLGPEHTYFGGT
ncbi:hypothetical protein GCM10018966_016640 [Streptomyces yanii]